MSLPKYILKDVADLVDERRSTVKGVQRLLRKGPYTLYVENGTIPFDDYFFEGKHLILGALTNVIDTNGCFSVVKADGRFSVTELYHVVRAKNDLDSDYLHHVLTNTPARQHAEISAQTIRLSENSLQHISLPWPEAPIRKAFVDFLDDSFSRIEDIEKKISAEYERGATLFEELFEQGSATIPLADICEIVEGRSLDAELREPAARIPVVSSQGIVGFTNTEGVEERCLVIGQAGQYLLAYRMEKGAFPLMDTVGVKVSSVDVSFEQLFFGLHAKKVRSRLRVINKQVDALAMALPDLSNLEFELGSPEQRKVFESRAKAILAGIDAMESKLSALKEKTRSTIDAFIALDENVLEDLAPWTPASAEMPGITSENVSLNAVVSSNRSLTRQNDSPFSARTKSAMQKMVNETLLDRVADNPSLTGFDVLWEVIPFIFLRLHMPKEEWDRLVEAKNQAARADLALDLVVAKKPSLIFLQEFKSQSSILTPESRAAIINAINAIYESEMTPALLRWFPHEMQYRPDAASRLITTIALAFSPKAKTVFDPAIQCGETVSPILQRLPNAHASGQSKEFPDSLIACLAASCELVNANIPEIMIGDTLADTAPSKESDLVVSILPPNEGEWTDHLVNADDPRWIFGVPPRNKANLAWLQHAFYHRSQDGFAVLGISNAALHEGRGCEPEIRRSIIESGCVRSVISLPGRLWQDDRAPMSIIVLGSPREDDCQTLFVNALDLGNELAAEYGAGHRVLSNDDVKRLSTIVENWVRGIDYEDIDELCKEASKEQISAIGDLTPWSFV